MRKQTVILAALAVVPALILYYPAFVWLYERYTAADSYYSHGFLVPFISAYLIWLKQEELNTLPGASLRTGALLVAGALLLHAFAAATQVHFLSGYSLLPLVFGVSLFLFGPRLTRRIWFPLAFLCFMLPLPLVFLNAASFPLKLLATKTAVFSLHEFLGVPVRHEGFRILFPRDVLVVDTPCSGLRSLISLAAMGSVFVHLLDAGPLRKTLLFTLALAVALASNIARLIVLCLGAFVFGSKAIAGAFHDISGYLVFVVSFLILWQFWRQWQCPPACPR